MIILVDIAIGLLIISLASLILGVGLKLIKENSKKDDK
jgi:hypothetical protein